MVLSWSSKDTLSLNSVIPGGSKNSDSQPKFSSTQAFENVVFPSKTTGKFLLASWKLEMKLLLTLVSSKLISKIFPYLLVLWEFKGERAIFTLCCSHSHVVPGTLRKIFSLPRYDVWSWDVQTRFRVFSMKCIGNRAPTAVFLTVFLSSFCVIGLETLLSGFG